VKVVYTARFRREIGQLERYIAERAAPDVALSYVDRLLVAVDGLAAFPLRWRLRPELGPRVRVLVFDGKYAVAYRVDEDRLVAGALYGPGQRLTAMEEDP
jgi:plasmid stabilization system protein ParE